ncbi:serine hydrolase domain-containing protein [Gallaecimonas xiamenensis]|uniref:Beta-lactamase-related domain-containing protein n=1 Tax=Gallaecimonas xiamenensis 3-C-1 TaxID=745411 RepID=K2IGG2_9GAMM|nr:serine hydrolase domain-containing protein [Gallaecimonas xiamenensis]EKE69151.1 hypothetical protein B3C1_15919 [Gallaecimonas xiamenensis 3-C-1]
MKAWIALALLLAAPLAVGAPAASAPYPIADFVAKIEALRQSAHIPGLSMAVVKDGTVLLATGLGYADLEQAVPAAADTPYDIASVAKPLSAVVALKLVEEGKLDLDRPLDQYSQWQGFCDDFSRQPSVLAKGLDCQAKGHSLRHLLSHTATGQPGRRFSYNPVLYSWASRPMMAVTNKRFSELVARYVFAPAGMTLSARKYRDLPLRADLATAQAQPYRIDDKGLAHRADARGAQGDGAAGGVVSTALDLARFDIALDEGRLISKASLALMMTPTALTGGTTAPYGLGWFIEPYQGHGLVWHSGWWEQAYSALYLKVPDQKLSFIVLANSEGVWWHNRPDRAEVAQSAFAQAFLATFMAP